LKAIGTVLCGIGAAAGHVALSCELSGECDYSLSVILGTVVALSLSGIRPGIAPAAGGKGKPKGEARRAKGEEEAPAEGGGADVSEPHRDADSSPAASPVNGGGAAGDSVPHPQPGETDVLSAAVASDGNPVLPPVDEGGTAEALWKRARGMEHSVIPDFEADAEYLNLVYSAAERGHVPALAKLGDYAFRRGAFVEAYFWTKVAMRRLELGDGKDPQRMREIDNMLRSIQREWRFAGQPQEFENVYGNFPEERGELGRAFLRLAEGVESSQTRDYIRCLADRGNPDAALFVGKTGGGAVPG